MTLIEENGIAELSEQLTLCNWANNNVDHVIPLT